MIELFHWLFYLGVLALVVGCFAYLFVTRDESKAGGTVVPLSAEVSMKAAALSGAYRLWDLESILEQLGAIEAWGVILELKLTTVQEEIQMVVDRNVVEFCAPSLEPEDTDLFRRAARDAGLQARTGYTEGQYCVDLKGTWPEIAGRMTNLFRSIYGVGDGEEVQVRIFN